LREPSQEGSLLWLIFERTITRGRFSMVNFERTITRREFSSNDL